MQLRDDDVFIVSLVADQRALGAVRIVRIAEPGQIPGFGRLVQIEERPPEPEFSPVVHVRLVVGPAAVDRVEVQPRRAKVDQGHRVVLLLKAGGRIERDVVIDELAEIRISGGDPGVLLVVLDPFLRMLTRGGRQQRILFAGLGLRASCCRSRRAPSARQPAILPAAAIETSGRIALRRAMNARRIDRHARRRRARQAAVFSALECSRPQFLRREDDGWDRRDHTFTHAGVFTMTFAASDL